MAWESSDRLIVRGEHWRVLRTSSFADCVALDLANQDRPGTNRTLLVPFDRPRRAPPPRIAMVATSRWCADVAGMVADSFPYGGLRFCPPTIRLLPYQLEPALAVFRHGATRLLIADDVGVGKTVEGGLIVREVAGAAHDARILILVPASLKDQWHQELRTLFAIEAVDANAAWLHASSSELPANVNPWSLPGIYLASTDFVKRPEALRPLEDVRWDLVVLDEAHANTPGSHRRTAVHALACRARIVVLLTATPHTGSDRQFEDLCGTGSVASSEPIVCFRRSRADVLPDFVPVRSRVLRVRISDAERRVHRELEAYTSRLWASAGGRPDTNPVLLATILRKRALSSAGSLVTSLRRRLQLMNAPVAIETQLWLPLGKDEDEERGPSEDLPADGVIGGAGLGDEGDERVRIERILEAAEPACASESKLHRLLRLLDRVHEAAIVFTEYRDTADRLREALEGRGHRVIVLHGGLTVAERRVAIAGFNRGDALLVATDAASEGLNLHHRCRLVIHFELPWSPSRLHQRCGRVNRIGQTRPVHEVALVADDTAERLVIDPLVRRAGVAGRFGGGALTSEPSDPGVPERLLAGVHHVRSPAVEPAPPSSLVTMNLRDEATAEAARLELLRRAKARWRPHPGGPPALPAAGSLRVSRSSGAALTMILTTTIRDRMGAPLEEETIAISGRLTALRWRAPRGMVRRQLVVLVEQIQPQLLRRLSGRTGSRLSAVRTMHRHVRRAVRQREAAIEGSLRSAARELVQAGLFDRVALRQAPRRTPGQVFAPDDGADERMIVRARVRVRAVLCGEPG
jgi:superfamily II DNA or RNA helicase